METYRLDGKQMRSKKGMHDHIREQFGFPDYYGGNLDALWDCLTEKRPGRIEVCNAEYAGRNLFPPVMKVFLDLCEQHPKWTLVIRSGPEREP